MKSTIDVQPRASNVRDGSCIFLSIDLVCSTQSPSGKAPIFQLFNVLVAILMNDCLVILAHITFTITLDTIIEKISPIRAVHACRVYLPAQTYPSISVTASHLDVLCAISKLPKCGSVFFDTLREDFYSIPPHKDDIVECLGICSLPA